MPKSIEKDYYIWRFIKQKSTSRKEAAKIIKEVMHPNSKLKKSYRKKVGKNPFYKKLYSKPLSKKARERMKKRQLNAKRIIKSGSPFSNWLKQSNAEKIFIFNNVGKGGRKLLDHPISKGLWQALCTHTGFNSSIEKIRKEHLKNLQKAFLYPPLERNALNYSTLSMLGFYALSQKHISLAGRYFLLASAKGGDREEVDRMLFWTYLSSRERRHLKKIIKSYDVNIYTMLARDFLKLKYPSFITPSLPKVDLLEHSKLTDPIYWAKLKRKIFSRSSDLSSLAKKYRSSDTVGFYTYIKSKESRYKKHYFPMPYRKILSKLPKTRQAIIYAIARQESKFIPASVSASYALGMMQIMPFLVDHLAKKLKEKIDYDDMFDPKRSLIYANEHMNYLTKWLQHPLYIAYAYNAGIGFTKRVLRKKNLFSGNKRYEPYLSIEMLPNAQANRYGKHVLVNYVVYMNKLGVELRMIDLLSTLHIPSKTDKFRK